MSLDWYPGIRECCAYWRDAAMLQQTFQALERAFAEENDACIDCAKSIVEVICRVIIDELDATASVKPQEENPSFGAWMSAAVRVLKLGDNRDNAFRKLVSQHHELTTRLGALRNGAGPVSHGKDGFIARLSAYHHRAAVLSADAIAAFLHHAYLEAEPNVVRTREPYERFERLNAAIDRNAEMTLEGNAFEGWTLSVSMGRDEQFALAVWPSQLMFHLDRQAYIEAAQIGIEVDKPSRLIVDGQQRLTSLYAVFRGKAVLDADYKERQIEVAFRPRDGRFDVADAAIRRDPEWIANISDLWSSGKSSYQMVKGFLGALGAKSEVTNEDEEIISHNLDRLFDLQKYPFTALEIAPTVDEEQVADIFVRINSEGVKLNQADFILTLLSVFWDEGRKSLETFCRASRQPSAAGQASPYNHFIQPDPDQLLRVGVAYGFNRGRLKSVYQILRGKDPDTGEFSPTRREEQFNILRDAQSKVLNLTSWHQFLSALVGAGYRSAEMISSQNALLYAYAFYLIGRERFEIAEHELQKAIGRWFFATSLTGRYTSSPETVMDGDLNRVKAIRDGKSFLGALDEIIGNELTSDYWSITLPANLDSSSARNPELFAYVAAQNRLGAPVLFSHKRISELIDPALQTKKKALERHHLFPRAWLERNGVDDLRQINQMANFALLEWPDNIEISDDSPVNYVAAVKTRFKPEDWRQMLELHALPEGWESMSYDSFLMQRRRLMADVVRRGFETLRIG